MGNEKTFSKGMWWDSIISNKSRNRKTCDFNSRTHSFWPDKAHLECGLPRNMDESDITQQGLVSVAEKHQNPCPSAELEPIRIRRLKLQRTFEKKLPAMAFTLILATFVLSPRSVRAADLCTLSGCGDGIVGPNEFCDDRNTLDGDGCSSQCTIECGYTCKTIWGQPCINVSATDIDNFAFGNSTCEPELGDSILTQKERDAGAFTFNGVKRLPCDDGNVAAGDGCQCNLPRRGEVVRRGFRRGCFVEDRWKCDTDRTPANLQCSSELLLPDRCDCITSEVEVTLQAVPLLGIPERTIQSLDGFSGSSPEVGCQVCNINHYTSECFNAESFCLGHVTCNGNGFCNGEGKCECWGNYTGTNCDKCIKDHYGVLCNKRCVAEETCGSHGYCNIEGDCLWNAFCDGIKAATPSNVTSLVIVNECGDGRRLGDEECDDGNNVNFDGCSDTCTVEPGFKCLGGCQNIGDPQRL